MRPGPNYADAWTNVVGLHVPCISALQATLHRCACKFHGFIFPNCADSQKVNFCRENYPLYGMYMDSAASVGDHLLMATPHMMPEIRAGRMTLG